MKWDEAAHVRTGLMVTLMASGKRPPFCLAATHALLTSLFFRAILFFRVPTATLAVKRLRNHMLSQTSILYIQGWRGKCTCRGIFTVWLPFPRAFLKTCLCLSELGVEPAFPPVIDSMSTWPPAPHFAGLVSFHQPKRPITKPTEPSVQLNGVYTPFYIFIMYILYI